MFKNTNHLRGILAEKISVWLLRCKLYSIVDTRVRSRFGEIDIIARKGSTLIFIEVKLRKNKAYLFEAITFKQKKRIVTSAMMFRANYMKLKEADMRFDVIFVSPWCMPIHIKNAWS